VHNCTCDAKDLQWRDDDASCRMMEHLKLHQGSEFSEDFSGHASFHCRPHQPLHLACLAFFLLFFTSSLCLFSPSQLRFDLAPCSLDILSVNQTTSKSLCRVRQGVLTENTRNSGAGLEGRCTHGAGCHADQHRRPHRECKSIFEFRPKRASPSSGPYIF
jgi:hypothetical protein